MLTHGVVTPNIVAAISGYLANDLSSYSKLTMPARAKAAFVNILVDMELRPDTSTIEGTIMMSLVTTYWDTFPEATVATITFGTPIGRALILGVTRDIPPVP